VARQGPQEDDDALADEVVQVLVHCLRWAQQGRWGQSGSDENTVANHGSVLLKLRKATTLTSTGQ